MVLILKNYVNIIYNLSFIYFLRLGAGPYRNSPQSLKSKNVLNATRSTTMKLNTQNDTQKANLIGKLTRRKYLNF